MATYTSNLNLEKPLQTELYNVDVFNANSDKIDAGVGARVKYTDALTMEEIEAATSLTNKVAAAAAAKTLKDALSNCLFWDVDQRMSISIPVTAGNWAYKNAGTVPTKAGYSFVGYYCVTMNSTGVSPSYQKNSNDIWVYGRSSGTATIICEPLFVKST